MIGMLEKRRARKQEKKGRAQFDESYYLASQWQLIRRKFFKHKLAILGMVVLGMLYFMALLCEFIAPYNPDTYDVKEVSLAEAVRVICEQPPAPLQRFWSGEKKVDPDLETIVGKALDKDVDRRYASAAALAEDDNHDG